jgi:hypothetical protein
VKLAVVLLLIGFARASAQSLTGTVIDAMGAVIPGTRITLTLSGEERETKAGNDGSFVFSGLGAGQYRITANAAGFSPYTGSIRIGEGEDVHFPTMMLELTGPCHSPVNPMVPRYRVDKILGKSAQIDGIVVPPRQVDVELKTIADHGVSSERATTDRHGRFRFSDVTPGRHRLYIEPAPGFLAVNPMDIISHPGELLVIEPVRLGRPPPPGPIIGVCE